MFILKFIYHKLAFEYHCLFISTRTETSKLLYHLDKTEYHENCIDNLLKED